MTAAQHHLPADRTRHILEDLEAVTWFPPVHDVQGEVGRCQLT